MKFFKEPIRLADQHSDAPSELREALRSAQNRLGSQQQVERVAQHMQPLLSESGIGISAGASVSIHPVTSWTGIKSVLSIVCVVAVGAGLGWYLWKDVDRPERAPSKVVPSRPRPVMTSNRQTERSTTETATPRPLVEQEPVWEQREMERKIRRSFRKSKRRIPQINSNPEDELRILKRAQDALHSQPIRALRFTEEHFQSYPSGLFSQEREMIAIEALIQLGRYAEGVERGKRFLKMYPRSTHAQRVQSILVDAGVEPGFSE